MLLREVMDIYCENRKKQIYLKGKMQTFLMLQRAAGVVITRLENFEIRGWILNKRDLQRLRLQD
jgi:hypothetical protein